MFLTILIYSLNYNIKATEQTQETYPSDPMTFVKNNKVLRCLFNEPQPVILAKDLYVAICELETYWQNTALNKRQLYSMLNILMYDKIQLHLFIDKPANIFVFSNITDSLKTIFYMQDSIFRQDIRKSTANKILDATDLFSDTTIAKKLIAEEYHATDEDHGNLNDFLNTLSQDISSIEQSVKQFCPIFSCLKEYRKQILEYCRQLHNMKINILNIFCPDSCRDAVKLYLRTIEKQEDILYSTINILKQINEIQTILYTSVCYYNTNMMTIESDIYTSGYTDYRKQLCIKTEKYNENSTMFVGEFLLNDITEYINNKSSGDTIICHSIQDIKQMYIIMHDCYSVIGSGSSDNNDYNSSIMTVLLRLKKIDNILNKHLNSKLQLLLSKASILSDNSHISPIHNTNLSAFIQQHKELKQLSAQIHEATSKIDKLDNICQSIKQFNTNQISYAENIPLSHIINDYNDICNIKANIMHYNTSIDASTLLLTIQALNTIQSKILETLWTETDKLNEKIDKFAIKAILLPINKAAKLILNKKKITNAGDTLKIDTKTSDEIKKSFIQQVLKISKQEETSSSSIIVIGLTIVVFILICVGIQLRYKSKNNKQKAKEEAKEEEQEEINTNTSMPLIENNGSTQISMSQDTLETIDTKS